MPLYLMLSGPVSSAFFAVSCAFAAVATVVLTASVLTFRSLTEALSEAAVDYPEFCLAVARAVSDLSADRGMVLGGSGHGEQIAANKVVGVRAALCNDLFTARLSRAHNNANVLAMGGRIVAFALAVEIMTVWLETEFEGGRHSARIRKIDEA